MDDAASHQAVDPRRYFEGVETESDRPEHEPVCLYLETTNRCNLLCTTCPRTYEELEPPADMSWELFTSIVDQIKRLPRAVLHGVGEPMLVKHLPRMVRYLKDRGAYVLFNTNGTVLNERNGRALIAADLDELRVSFDAANAESYRVIRGKNYFNRILKNVRAFRELQEREGHLKPRVSAWLTGLRETVEELPDFVRLAAETGIKEVHLQRLVFFKENAIGMARPDQALYERLSGEEAAHIDRATLLAKLLGVTFSASGGASEPGMSLKRSDNGTPETGSPWSLCRRPWTVMYFTANGRALPCCIAPFSQRGYENYTLGDATQQTLREIWTGPAYSDFRKALKSDKPPDACASCGLRWSLLAIFSPPPCGEGQGWGSGGQSRAETNLTTPPPYPPPPSLHSGAQARDPGGGRENVAVVIPTFNEAESIAAVVAELPRAVVDRVIVADGGSIDGTPERAREAGAEVIVVGRGYGQACLAGAQAAETADIIVFMDGDGADDPIAIAAMVGPIRSGDYDFVIASRARGKREPGSMASHQILAGLTAGWLTKFLYGVRYTDMCAFRAIRRDTLLKLGMRELTYGWNLEMQMRAARAGLRVLEVPVAYRRRLGGESKVAGSLCGTVKAGLRIISTFVRVATESTRARHLYR